MMQIMEKRKKENSEGNKLYQTIYNRNNNNKKNLTVRLKKRGNKKTYNRMNE